MPPTNFLREVKSDFRKPFTSTTLYDDEVNKNIILVISSGCVANHHVGSLPLSGASGVLSKCSIFFVCVS